MTARPAEVERSPGLRPLRAALGWREAQPGGRSPGQRGWGQGRGHSPPPLRDPEGALVYLTVFDTRDKGGREEGPPEGNDTGGKRLTLRSVCDTPREAGRAPLRHPARPVPGSLPPRVFLGFRPSLSDSGRSGKAGLRGERLGLSPSIILWKGQRRDRTRTEAGAGAGRAASDTSAPAAGKRPRGSRLGIFKSGGASPLGPTTPPVYRPGQSASGPPFFKPSSCRQSGSSSTFLS